MNFDEQKLKRLDNIRLNDNQYENVRHIQHSIEFKKASFYSPFFYLYEKKFDEHFDECLMNKIRDKKLNVIVGKHSKFQRTLSHRHNAYNVS